jgi:hypothetical protein
MTAEGTVGAPTCFVYNKKSIFISVVMDSMVPHKVPINKKYKKCFKKKMRTLLILKWVYFMTILHQTNDYACTIHLVEKCLFLAQNHLYRKKS